MNHDEVDQRGGHVRAVVVDGDVSLLLARLARPAKLTHSGAAREQARILSYTHVGGLHSRMAGVCVAKRTYHIVVAVGVQKRVVSDSGQTAVAASTPRYCCNSVR